MKSAKRLLLPALGLILLLALVLALRPAPLPVSAVTAERGDFVESIWEEGRTRLRDTYTLSAPIGGYLLRVEPEPGDALAPGEVVFRLEPSPAPALDARSLGQARETLSAAEARLQNATAQLATAEADARLALSEFERVSSMHQRGLVSTAELERARATRDRQEAARRAAASSVDVARHERQSARLVLDIASGQRPVGEQTAVEVTAPIEGVVLRVHRCCEGAVQAGEPILDVGSLDDLEVQVDLLSHQAVRVSEGMEVALTGWGGDQALAARVRRVEPAGFTRISALGVEEQRVPIVIDFDDPEQAWAWLGVGYRVEAEFFLWRGEDVLQVPSSALFRLEDRWQVFVVEEGRARLRSVEPGRSSGLRTQILNGLDVGDRVITHPDDQLEAGARVRVDASAE
ncbi:efflux RND transporter periplasmic adaptor subunit [Wenzhouxiangella marina]|uniref:Efflux transporter, RND family, MFP subunit n=1 Tax=Wenzhouxiangella marina TaxID=1579979 RepID=A0A0K0XSF9_9GAMM|nr:HlyD family efflux transporter periplasmic adaptor subunit [Wenzhouxiangella marina]AKS40557.1 Efflux transporter, RND family, MFP subunit [Wenzhouxiangella marina]MBB6088325.1 HlyD family secretion protein [Wenzhouxiangella marina]